MNTVPRGKVWRGAIAGSVAATVLAASPNPSLGEEAFFVCGSCASPEGEGAEMIVPSPGTHYYEVVPGVIRSDGSQPFRILVTPGRSVNRIYLSQPVSRFIVSRVDFLDDGTDGDEAAGDGVYTSGLFTLIPPSHPLYFLSPTETLEGVDYEDTGKFSIVETDGSETRFLTEPSVGIIDPAIPQARILEMDENAQQSSHLLNIRNDSGPAGQNSLHYLGVSASDHLKSFMTSVYGKIGDDFDFIVLLSIVRGEHLPRTNPLNSFNGRHVRVRNEVSGIGSPNFDCTADYGSSGRLQGINLIDTGRRGVKVNILIHETTHRWSASISSSSELKADASHWHAYSNAGSVLGGSGWIAQADGSWLIDPEQRRSRLRVMAPIDRYLAGFVPASEVPPLMVYDTSTLHPSQRLLLGVPILPEEIVLTVPIETIIADEGPRLPAHPEEQWHFNLLFIAETVDRLLTAEEMTFYNLLAKEFERILPPESRPPLLEDNWAPATAYFGSNIRLSSRFGGWDDDEDDLHDDWETTYFGDLSQAGGDDPDHDGSTNLEEMACLGHPLHADTSKPVRVFRTADQVILEWTHFLPTVNYVMEVSEGEMRTAEGWEPAGFGAAPGPHFKQEIPIESLRTGLAPRRQFLRTRIEANPYSE